MCMYVYIHIYKFWIADHLVNRWITLSRVWGFLLIWAKGKKSQRPGYRWDASITWSRKMSWLTCICRCGREWKPLLCLFALMKNSRHTSFLILNLNRGFIWTDRQQWRQPWGWMILTSPWASMRRQVTSTSKATGTRWLHFLSTG